MNVSTLTETIFDFKDDTGHNCIMTSFEMMLCYENTTKKFTNSTMPMFCEIETTILYLIKLAEDNALNVHQILNWTTENGATLFFGATWYSESLAKELLKYNVDVKTVNNQFLTPSFRVSLEHFLSF